MSEIGHFVRLKRSFDINDNEFKGMPTYEVWSLIISRGFIPRVFK